VYVVRNKRSQKILHINPAPLSQGLAGEEIYHAWNPKTMEIGRFDGAVLPEHFRIDEAGEVIPLTLEEKVAAGLVELPAEEKAVGDQVVEKTLAEKVADGLITLEPHQKVVGNEIVSKTASELVAEGLVTREDIRDRTERRLRQETAALFDAHRTPGGYRLDDLARQKATASVPFRHLSASEEPKKGLLAARLIYPDAVLDEILAGVSAIQATYQAAKTALTTAVEKGAPVEKWAAITLTEHLPTAAPKSRQVAPKSRQAAAKPARKAPKKKPAGPKKGGRK